MNAFNVFSQSVGYMFARVAVGVSFFFDMLQFLGLLALVLGATLLGSVAVYALSSLFVAF